MEMIIYFDMDGVLTMLDNLLELNQNANETRGDVITRLCKEKGHSWIFENAPASPLLSEMRALMRDIKAKGHQVEVLTSLGLPSKDHPGCEGRREGKRVWLGKYLSSELIDGIITKINMVHSCELKGEFGCPNSILIDDQLEPNIKSFEERSGLGVHYSIQNHNKCVEKIRAKI